MAESQLQQEIRSSRPFHSSSQEAMIGVLRTADLLRRHLELAMGAADITPQQYNVLRILRGAGAGGLPTLTIGTRMVERAPGVTRLLDRLERRGLVVRQRSNPDRRQVVCTLTDAGRRLLAELDAPVHRADEAALDMLSDAERRQLVALLDRVRTVLAERLGDETVDPA